jgi:hypothetical protein
VHDARKHGLEKDVQTLDNALASKPASLVPAVVVLPRLTNPASLSVAVEPETALAGTAAALVLATSRGPGWVRSALKPKAPLASHVLSESARTASTSGLPTSGGRRLLLLLRSWLLLLRPRTTLLVASGPSPGTVGYILATAYTPRMNLPTSSICT